MENERLTGGAGGFEPLSRGLFGSKAVDPGREIIVVGGTDSHGWLSQIRQDTKTLRGRILFHPLKRCLTAG